MTQLLQQLRHRSRALANGLLVVLLATWMSTLCQHCLAQAAAAPAASAHCQHDAPPSGDNAAHDCCPQTAAPICDGGDCAQVSNIVSSEPPTQLITATPTHALLPVEVFSHVYAFKPPPPLAVAYTAITDSCPRYLRNCVFRL